jgi:cytochrome c553
VQQGIGRMPSFPNVNEQSMNDLLDYLRTPAKAAGDKKEMAAKAQPMLPPAHEEDSPGRAAYVKRCAICHGDNREGIPPSFPMLIGLGARMSASQTADFIHTGKGRMPPMQNVKGAELESLLKYLGVDASSQAKAEPSDYVFTGYKKFLDPEGYPAFRPPWGTLNAIDLKTGKYLWKINLGEFPELAALGMKDTGSENYGGPIVTAGDVLFIGASIHDRKFRAFDTSTGKLLWETELPYGGVATPATFMVEGKQFVVIGASDARDPKLPQGGAYVAFALP